MNSSMTLQSVALACITALGTTTHVPAHLDRCQAGQERGGEGEWGKG